MPEAPCIDRRRPREPIRTPGPVLDRSRVRNCSRGRRRSMHNAPGIHFVVVGCLGLGGRHCSLLRRSRPRDMAPKRISSDQKVTKTHKISPHGPPDGKLGPLGGPFRNHLPFRNPGTVFGEKKYHSPSHTVPSEDFPCRLFDTSFRQTPYAANRLAGPSHTGGIGAPAAPRTPQSVPGTPQ